MGSGRRTKRVSGIAISLGALGVAFLMPAGLPAQVSLGPLRIAEQNPLYRLQYTPEPEGPDVIGDGNIGLSLLTFYSNIFEQSSSDHHEQLFDLEQMTNTFGLRYGLARSLEVGGELSFHTGWGGFLDAVVSGFHEAVGFPNGGRETEPNGQHHLRLSGQDPAVRLDLTQRTLELEGGTVFAKWQAVGTRESPFALSVRATARRAGGPLDPGRIDGALVIMGRASGVGEHEGIHIHGSAGIARLTPPAGLETLFTETVGYFLFASERRLSSAVTGIVQVAAGTPYLRGYDVGELSRFPMSLSLGVAGETGGGWDWQVAFTEDFPPDSPSVDFTLTLGIVRVLSP